MRLAIANTLGLALTLALAAGGTALAHDGHEHEDPGAPHLSRNVRVWADAGGVFHVHGSFVAARDGVVQIRKEDGTLADLKLAALAESDRAWVQAKLDAIKRQNEAGPVLALAAPEAAAPEPQRRAGAEPPAIAAAFRPFESTLKIGWDDRFLLVESNGMPDHPMMIGIRAWQQQVPLPQDYRGENAWRIPLFPRPAARPMSAKDNFFRGAIALAVNGVPIFNPIKNDGRTDTFLAGELDEYGGHCGRADDYHYHIAPVHLEPKTGKGKPLAFALDGYPIFGYDEPDGSKARALDRFNGHEDARGHYHYHATKAYPYLNGGFHGEVTERDGQVDPQPRTQGVRPALPPLRGATITGFESRGDDAYRLTYQLRNQPHRVDYAIAGDGTVTFDFVDPTGAKTTETYRPRPQGEGRRPQGEGRRPPPPRDEPPPRRKDQPARKGGQGGRGPDPNDPNRRPWMQVHAAEMDADRDGTLTQAELTAVVDRTFDGYDRARDGVLTPDDYEQGGGVRSAMGGFVRQHAEEIDADRDGKLTRDELKATASRMFDRADRDRDGKLGPAELGPAEGQDPPPPGDRRPEGQDRPARKGAQPKGQDRPARKNAQPKGQDRPARKGEGRGAPRQESPDDPPPFHTEVPAHPIDVIAGRPTDRSITLSLMAAAEATAFVAYGETPEAAGSRSRPIALTAGRPAEVVLDGLASNTRYHYRIHWKPADAEAFRAEEPSTFQTGRPPGSTFTFAVQADSHLDLGTTPALYLRTLDNMAADGSDFLVDLGDTFMTDKFARHDDSISQYRAQRYYLGRPGRALPLFLTLGNHDGETGAARDGGAMGTWSTTHRNRFFPNPRPDAFYSGNAAAEPDLGPPADYYGWRWGDALFLVLDPFRYSPRRARDGWDRTLGEAQYRWLESTLKANDSKYTFVFIHHLVGGEGREGRGGAEASAFFEWGGGNADGTPAFQERRPGWPRPIHKLLVDHGVSAVFHGHDHFYARQERDGLVYQLVPQPGNPRTGTPRSAEEYGYREGDLRNGPGYLRVTVSPRSATVDYVLSALPEPQRGGPRNGEVAATYTISPRRDPQER